MFLVVRGSQDDCCHLYPNAVIFLRPTTLAFAGRIFSAFLTIVTLAGTVNGFSRWQGIFLWLNRDPVEFADPVLRRKDQELRGSSRCSIQHGAERAPRHCQTQDNRGILRDPFEIVSDHPGDLAIFENFARLPPIISKEKTRAVFNAR